MKKFIVLAVLLVMFVPVSTFAFNQAEADLTCYVLNCTPEAKVVFQALVNRDAVITQTQGTGGIVLGASTLDNEKVSQEVLTFLGAMIEAQK